jgi:hypothetical protein
MASFFRNVLASGIGATEQLIMTTGAITPNANATAYTTIIGLSLTNTTENIVLASIRLDNGTTDAYFVKEVHVLDRNPIGNLFGRNTDTITGGRVIDTIYVVIDKSQLK